MSCLILFKSITYAQNALVRLSNAGITAYISRKPGEIGGKSCGYALKIKCQDIARCCRILQENGIAYSSCWQKVGNKWRELSNDIL